MEPSCGQSIVKCEKQKDDGRMETQKRKQNEKEKNSIDDGGGDDALAAGA